MSFYADGRRARRLGKAASDNPHTYPGHSGQWRRGWEDQDYEMKKGYPK